ncbi:MAG: NADH:flavin oxidoreductase [Promethearchaeota archaeon]
MFKNFSSAHKIGSLVIKNRLVRSATYECMATVEDGSVTQELIYLYKTLAEGGVGLIITGLTYVHPSGRSYHNQTAIDNDSLIPGLRKIAETVHEYGDGCRIAIQLAHSGFQSLLENTIAPSAVLEQMMNNMPREMTVKEIEEIIEAFAKSVWRAKEAGFDAVQLHAAHGYLLSEFLSPFTNKRTDGYGGNTTKRIKIIEDIYKRSIEFVGKDFPILIKMNVDDFLEGGIDLKESQKIAEKLSRIGFAAIETSSCMWAVVLRNEEEIGFSPSFIPESRIKINSKDKEAYHRPYAKEIKKVIGATPLILVGGIRSLDVIEEILAEGSADFIALSRPLIREPNLPNKWLNGTGGLTAECISCNGCIGVVAQEGVHCTQI